jgi:DNA primase
MSLGKYKKNVHLIKRWNRSNVVTARLSPSDFTTKTIPKRLEKKGDLFKGVLDKKIRKNNSKVLKQFL